MRAAVVLLPALLVGCATQSPLPAPTETTEVNGIPIAAMEQPGVSDGAAGVRFPLIVPAAADGSEDFADLPLTVYPTPIEAAYEDTMIRVDDAAFVGPGHPELGDALSALALDAAYAELPAGGYVLRVTVAEGGGLIVLAAQDASGEAHARRALLQLSRGGPDGSVLARECLIVDRPGFPLRGSKRPEPWELEYGANFVWGAGVKAKHVGRTMLPFYAPGATLDAGAEGIERALRALRPWQDRGVTAFAVKFDDVGFGLSPESRLRFGSYPTAAVHFMAEVQAALRARDTTTRVYYLPQTYWWNDDRLESFARALRMAGGLPVDAGLVMTGPEVISGEIDSIGLATSRAAFGLTKTKALIYDNLGREGDWGPLTGRDAGLTEQADAVFGERGTTVNRMTRLDWSWNPWAYDAETSWRRAIYELAGPEGYERLRAACAAFRERASRPEAERAVQRFAVADLGGWPSPVPQDELVRLLRKDLPRLEPDVSVDATR